MGGHYLLAYRMAEMVGSGVDTVAASWWVVCQRIVCCLLYCIAGSSGGRGVAAGWWGAESKNARAGTVRLPAAPL